MDPLFILLFILASLLCNGLAWWLGYRAGFRLAYAKFQKQLKFIAEALDADDEKRER